MSTHQVQLLTENLPEQRFLEALFLEESQQGLVEVSSFLLRSTAIAAAELYLMQYPECPIALVLNAGSKSSEAIEKEHAALGRVLGRITRKNWHVALAVPRVDDWIGADRRVRALFDSDPAAKDNRYEQAVRIGRLAQEKSLDREAIAAAFPEFRALAEFVAEKVRPNQPVA